MKNNKTNILLVIIALLAGWNIFTTSKIQTNVEEYNKKIDLIQVEIDSVQVINEQLTQEITKLDGEINNIDGDITNVTKNITQIKKQTNEKIDAVNEFTFSDLSKFFTDRYENGIGNGYDSTSKGNDR
jgi:peptidoglycan hydrolase CwlO-like protein